MGFNPTIQINTTMKTILLICAFAALASAHPSDDVATDLLTVTEAHADGVVPETNFAQETAKVGGHWTDCKLGVGDCAKPTIYTTSRVHHCKTKKACQYKVATSGMANSTRAPRGAEWSATSLFAMILIPRRGLCASAKASTRIGRAKARPASRDPTRRQPSAATRVHPSTMITTPESLSIPRRLGNANMLSTSRVRGATQKR